MPAKRAVPEPPAQPAATPSPTIQVVAFTIGGDEYALPIGTVQEIIRYAKPRRLDMESPWIAGMISLRGRILPVCDLGVHLRRSAPPGQDAKIVVVDCLQGVAGIVVEDVTGVLTVDRSQLSPLPGSSSPQFMNEIAQVDDRLIVIIEPDQLLIALGVANDGNAEPQT